MRNFKIVFLLIGLLLSSSPAWSSDEQPTSLQPHELIVNTTEFQVAYGNPDAPIVLKEYSSFTCPHCREFHEKVIDKIMVPYIDAGKVYYLFRFFPLDMSALKASMLVHCLNDNKQKNDLVSLLFQKQQTWSSAESELDLRERITAIAVENGIQTSGFDVCISDASVEEKMLYNRIQLIEQAGIRSTPTLYINNKEYLDHRGLKQFTSALDSALQSAGMQNNELADQPAMAAIPPDTSDKKNDCASNSKKAGERKDEAAMAAIPHPEETEETGKQK